MTRIAGNESFSKNFGKVFEKVSILVHTEIYHLNLIESNQSGIVVIKWVNDNKRKIIMRPGK